MARTMQDVKGLIDKLDRENALNLDEWEEIIHGRCEQVAEYAAEIARKRSQEIFGNKIYVDVEIRVNASYTLQHAHEIAEEVHDKIEKDFPKVKHIMVHVNPEK